MFCDIVPGSPNRGLIIGEKRKKYKRLTAINTHSCLILNKGQTNP